MFVDLYSWWNSLTRSLFGSLCMINSFLKVIITYYRVLTRKNSQVAVKPAAYVHFAPPPLRNKMEIWYRYAEPHLDTSPPILAPCIIVLTILCYSSMLLLYIIYKDAIYKIGRFLPTTPCTRSGKRLARTLTYPHSRGIHLFLTWHLSSFFLSWPFRTLCWITQSPL